MSFNLTLNSSNVLSNTNNSQYSYKFLLGAIEIYKEAEIQLTKFSIKRLRMFRKRKKLMDMLVGL